MVITARVEVTTENKWSVIFDVSVCFLPNSLCSKSFVNKFEYLVNYVKIKIKFGSDCLSYYCLYCSHSDHSTISNLFMLSYKEKKKILKSLEYFFYQHDAMLEMYLKVLTRHFRDCRFPYEVEFIIDVTEASSPMKWHQQNM